MPPCAISKRPLRSCRASVNAPRTWPNISLSKSDDGDAAEIDLDERPAGTPAVAMDRFGDELLAGAALAGDQHRRVGRGDASHQLQDAQQPRVLADQVAEVVPPIQLLARRHALVRLRARRGEAERGLHGVEHLLVGPGLGDEVGGARPSCPPRRAGSIPTR